ncbi:MAG: LysR family transcriptional regulator [Ardenticatenaceae bacterium]|nr:LysR family transcriptional regulator [Ardenticatenaceae bacterium]
MNIDQLIAFDRIVRDGSFSRAAWALQIAQPTISARIMALEKTVGGSLFERNNRAVTLTERGVGFLPFARQALEALQKGLDAASHASSSTRGELHIAVLRSLAGGLAAPALKRFFIDHPEVACIIGEGSHWQIVEWLHDNQIELGLVTWPPVGPHITDMTPLLRFREPVVLLAHHRHPLAQLKRVTQADVARLSNPFILLRWWQVTPDPVAKIVEVAQKAVDVPTDTGRFLIANGIGAGFFNLAQFTPELMSPEIVQIEVVDLPQLFRDSAVVRLKRNSTLSPAATHFIDCIRTQAAKLNLLSPKKV